MIVTAVWSIYPLGHYYDYLPGRMDEALLNVRYNQADYPTVAWITFITMFALTLFFMLQA